MRVLVYFQHKPYPATTGAHIRCQAVLRALRELGHEVMLFSSNLLTDTSWTAESVAEVEKTFGIRVVIHRGTPDDTLYCAAIRWDDLPRKQWGDFAPPAMKAAFVAMTRDWQPDAVIINYTFFGNLIRDPVFSRTLKIMESLDMFSLNGQMQRAFLRLLPGRPIHPERVCTQLLDQTFLSDLDLSVWPEEYAICDQFDVTTAVSRNETEGIAAHTSNTQAVWAPITAEARELFNTYGGNPVYMAAINALNVQGYLYFARKVLPLIQSRQSNFMLDAVGACSTIMNEVSGIRNLGYVPSLEALYRDAAFAICPLIGATGQQIKVIEAMAHGVPAVVLRNVAASSPVIHGVNGFIADTPEEMAGYCLRLRADQQLCRSLGNAARTIVARDWSQQRLVNTFREILSRKPGAASCCRKPSARTRQAGKTTAPDFSLVVDARVRSEDLRVCLASVSNQSGVTQETIVVSAIPLAGYRHATSIAEALAAANGRWIGVLHASDMLQPNALAMARRALRNNRCRGWITSRLVMVDTQGRIQWMQEAVARVGGDVLAQRSLHSLLLHSPGTFFQRHLVDPSSLDSAASCADQFAQIWLQLFRQAQPLPVDALLGCSRFGAASGIDDLLLQASFSRLMELPEVRDRKTLRPLFLPDAIDALRGQQRRLDRQAFLGAEEARQQDAGNPGVLTRLLLEGYVRNRWRELAGPAHQSMRIALFGAGIHTHWLLGMVKNVPGPEVIAILDDFADTGNAIAGIPIERPVGFDVRRIDAIALSSDTSVRKFEERVLALFGMGMRVCKLYEGLPPGPYPKQL